MTAPLPAPAEPTVASGGGSPPRAGLLPAWVLVPLAALVWWAGGYAWWLLDGLGGPDGVVGGGTASALPLSASALSSLVMGAATGGIAAGLLGLLVRSRPRALGATAGGVGLAVTATLLHSAGAVRDGAAGTFAAEPVVVAGLSAAVAGAALAGWLLGCAALLGRPGLGVALGVLAGLAPSWVSGAVAALGGTPDGSVEWAGAVVLAAALVAVGLRPPVRLAWWPLVLLAAWLTGPALTALAYLEPLLRPGAGLPDTLLDSVSAAWQVFGLAAEPGSRVLGPWWAAVVVALLVSAALGAPRGRRAGPRTAPTTG